MGDDIYIYKVPQDERDAAQHLQSHLDGLKSHEEDFSAAVDLIAHSRELTERYRPFRHNATTDDHVKFKVGLRWIRIAANSAAVTVAQIWDRINAIKHAARQCPSLQQKINWQAIDEAIAAFKTDFPHRKQVRDGYAHSVDKAYSQEKILENRSDSVFMQNSMIGNKLSHTIDGEFVELEVNTLSLEKLVKLRLSIYSAFEKAR